MSKFEIEGRKELKGKIQISGAKNAALKILPASILGSTNSIIKNVPKISDIDKMISILQSIGAEISRDEDTININTSNINSFSPDEKLIKKLRGSIVTIGPLLAKFGEAIFSKPGGCLIGSRPIDDHLDIFRQMGIEITEDNNSYHLIGKPKAADIILNKLSVTATENAIMASVFVDGVTNIHVAAAEPEIIDLANFLNQMGAKISGAGTHDIKVEGVTELHGTEYEIMPDRIEAGTYLIAAIAANSEIEIGPVISNHLSIVLKKLRDAGAQFEIITRDGKEFIQTKKHNSLTAVDVDTRTYPGFPTDLQSPFVVLMTQAKGECKVFETLFEGRFLYLDELILMGANIEILSPQIIKIEGPTQLKSSDIFSRDIRGGAALVIAALIATDTTTVNGLEFIDRGYENMDQKLASVGASIRRIEDN